MHTLLETDQNSITAKSSRAVCHVTYSVDLPTFRKRSDEGLMCSQTHQTRSNTISFTASNLNMWSLEFDRCTENCENRTVWLGREVPTFWTNLLLLILMQANGNTFYKNV